MIIAFLFSAAGQQTWTVEKDCLLTSVGAIGAATVRAVVSSDPSATSALFTAPSANAVDKNLLAYCNGGSTPEKIALPFSAGERVLIAISAAGTIVISAENS